MNSEFHFTPMSSAFQFSDRFAVVRKSIEDGNLLRCNTSMLDRMETLALTEYLTIAHDLLLQRARQRLEMEQWKNWVRDSAFNPQSPDLGYWPTEDFPRKYQ